MNTPHHFPQLFFDLYQLTMCQSYWRGDPTKEAVFELSFRTMPPNRGYLSLFGIEKSIEYACNLSFDQSSLEKLADLGKFDPKFLDYLANMKFTGNIWSMNDGDILFAGEPAMQLRGPIIQLQLLETILINTINLRTLLATKSSRVVQAAAGKPVIDFGARRAHGLEAAGTLSEASFLAGFSGTATVNSGAYVGFPLVGTMAHSYVLSFDSELDAFRAYASEFGSDCTLLVDTFDTMAGVNNAITVAKEMESRGDQLRAVRLDSGDLEKLSKFAKEAFVHAGLPYVNIVASGGLDEYRIEELEKSGARIDGYGVGTRVSVSDDAPWAESVYKLVEVEGRPVFKTSKDKESSPYQKDVYRKFDDTGSYIGDVVSPIGTMPPYTEHKSLLEIKVASGRRVEPQCPIELSRSRHLSEIGMFPARFKKLLNPDSYPVETLYTDSVGD